MQLLATSPCLETICLKGTLSRGCIVVVLLLPSFRLYARLALHMAQPASDQPPSAWGDATVDRRCVRMWSEGVGKSVRGLDVNVHNAQRSCTVACMRNCLVGCMSHSPCLSVRFDFVLFVGLLAFHHSLPACS